MQEKVEGSINAIKECFEERERVWDFVGDISKEEIVYNELTVDRVLLKMNF